MNKKNKSAPFLMILVLSIIATQLSLKAFGVNLTPSLGTIIASWGKVAGVIGCVYQPGLLAELDALSDHFLHTDSKVAQGTENLCGELACNQSTDFELEPPPPIEANDPSVTIEEPVQEFCVMAISRSTGKKEILDAEKLNVEVVQIAADSDEENAADEAKSEAKAESIRSIAVGITADDPEAESEASAPQFMEKIFVRGESFQVAPKPDGNKKPCQELERLRKLEETRKSLEEFQLETQFQLMNQGGQSFEFQASMAKKYLEKARRVRVIIKRNPLALPHSSKTDSLDFLTGPEESEL